MHSPFPWMGGKRRLAAAILKRFPPHECYVEPFAGSGALLFARERPAELEVLNDVDGDLVNFFRVLKHHLVEFCNQFRFAVVSRQIFEWSKATPPETLTDIQRAARFLYLQKLCFGGRPTNRSFGVITGGRPRLNLARLEEDLSALHERLHQVVIEKLDWRDCLVRYDRRATLFFMDPPYFETAGYGGRPWQLADYEALAGDVRALKGKALVTVNDVAELRRVFAGLPAEQLHVRYTVGGMSTDRPPSKELLIRSWGGARREKR